MSDTSTPGSQLAARAARSGLGAPVAAAGRVSRSQLASDGRRLYWLESRPHQGGRLALVRSTGAEEAGAGGNGGDAEEISLPGADIRSRVHEYGGGAYCLVAGGDRRQSGPGDRVAVAYVDRQDQRIWMFEPGRPDARPLTEVPPDGQRWHHGDLQATPDGRWVLAVRERHAGGRVGHSLVAVSTGELGTHRLAAGRDFLTAPRVDPSGQWLAFVCWDHPHMSWECSELWVGRFDPSAGADGGGHGDGDGDVSGRGFPPEAVRVAGGPDVSVGQPQWRPGGELLFVSDAGGWWQPWQWTAGSDEAVRLCGEPAEFHGPDWSLGQSTIAAVEGGQLACRVFRDGFDSVTLLDPSTGKLTELAQPCTAISGLCAHRGGAAWLGRTALRTSELWWAGPEREPERGPGPERGDASARLRTPEPFGPQDALLLPGDQVSRAVPFQFPVPALAGEGEAMAYGLYYPPGPDPEAGEGPAPRAGKAPPLVVSCHGGPTGQSGAGFDVVTQFFTSRGFAVAAVDFRGSTGYGRAYRLSLAGQWGVVDTDDCVAAAEHLVRLGWADPARLVVRGTSSGGLTALNALVRAGCFAAAAAWYGVTDLVHLAATTHDFEAHYSDWLIGPLPEAGDEYRRRSPLARAGEMRASVLLCQGLDDPVVPPEQATALAAALEARGVRCELLTFEGESHGFRRAATVEACLQAELAFFVGVLGASTG